MRSFFLLECLPCISVCCPMVCFSRMFCEKIGCSRLGHNAPQLRRLFPYFLGKADVEDCKISQQPTSILTCWSDVLSDSFSGFYQDTKVPSRAAHLNEISSESFSKFEPNLELFDSKVYLFC